ncbi:DUF6114 domain-containing protein [Agromyces soli]
MRPSDDHRTIDATDDRDRDLDFADVLRPAEVGAGLRHDAPAGGAEPHAAEPDAEEPGAEPDAAQPDSSPAADSERAGGFAGWYRSRPLVGALVTVIAGVALFFSSQLELGHLTVHVGIEGMQATILPIVLSLSGVLAIAMPAHRVFYGVIALVIAVYSLVAVNLGGFFIGFLLGCVGGVMVVSWAPRRARGGGGAPEADDRAARDEAWAGVPGDPLAGIGSPEASR